MADVRMVNLYYVGGLANHKALVTAKGVSYRIPEPGEFLNVPFFVARDLIRRNKMPNGASVFTTDGSLVKRLIAEAKTASDTKAPTFTREQLLEMLNDLDENIQTDMSEGSKAAKRAANAKKVEEA